MKLGLNAEDQAGTVEITTSSSSLQIILLQRVPPAAPSRDRAIKSEIYYEFSFQVFNGKRPIGVFALQRWMKINCVPRC